MRDGDKYAPKRRFPWWRIIPIGAFLCSSALVAFGVAKQSMPDVIAGFFVIFAAKIRDIY